MNIGLYACLLFTVIFGIMAAVFVLLKEKGAMLISGFNTLTEEKRDQYDKVRMCIDQRNSFLLWAVIMAAGALLSWMVSQYLAIAAFAVWLVFFFREVHPDAEKAFQKYKIEK